MTYHHPLCYYTPLTIVITPYITYRHRISPYRYYILYLLTPLFHTLLPLFSHQASVNGIAWAPHSPCHICTIRWETTHSLTVTVTHPDQPSPTPHSPCLTITYASSPSSSAPSVTIVKRSSDPHSNKTTNPHSNPNPNSLLHHHHHHQ